MSYIIVAESETGEYEPIGEAVTLNEAVELVTSDMKGRLRDLEAGQSPLCPYQYRGWFRNSNGSYTSGVSWLATELQV
jgi:hypothetical protein